MRIINKSSHIFLWDIHGLVCFIFLKVRIHVSLSQVSGVLCVSCLIDDASLCMTYKINLHI